MSAYPNRKIVIFYSSIGYGHISAAQAVKEEISKLNPKAQVLLQDIREFMHPIWRRIDERLYWFVAANLPECFDALFHNVQARGNSALSLSQLPNDYPEEKVLEFLKNLAPDAVLAAHYGSAQVLGNLREKGLLTDIRIGWLHTDFFEGYLPRISKRIDRTFLAHHELESRWLAAGVPAEKVVTSGLPVCICNDDRGREAILNAIGLYAHWPTVVITSGKEGVSNYSAIIEGIAEGYQDHIQIIAVCGKNTRQQAMLNELKGRLAERIIIRVFGLVPHNDLLSWVKAADILITKAGGMTPVEAFAMSTPTVLIDAVSGHERENAALFTRLGVAEQAVDPKHAGKLVNSLLADRKRADAMRKAQREFKENINIARIAEFALDETFVPVVPPPDFGVENGAPVLNMNETLAELDAQVPAELELLLSYSTSQKPQRIVLENPFGHIAIRIHDTVYSANYIADPSVDPNFLQHMGLADYLYGVCRPSPLQIHTNTYGMAYGRENIGLRVSGIAPWRIDAMVNEANQIEDGFRSGKLRWDRSNFNCADIVKRILHAGGYSNPPTLLDKLGLPAMPLDVFERARAVFENDPSLRVELVAYRQIPGTHASYRFSRFPLSIRQPLRSMALIIKDSHPDSLGNAVTRQITGFGGDRRLYLEDLRTHLPIAAIDEPIQFSRSHRRLADAAAKDLRRLLEVNAALHLREFKHLKLFYGTKEIRRLLDRTLDLARIATERAEYMLKDEGAKRLRRLFIELVCDYGRISGLHIQSQKIDAYLKRFQNFETAMVHEFTNRRLIRFARASTFWRSLRLRLSRRNKTGDRQGKNG
ncbi:MAG: MGDG synthase family glycosyltransferase [Dissulfurimicrobium sp.]